MTPADGSPPVPRVAIVGSANVGKSTLFNRLVGSRRAITHPTPGVTRDPVEAPFEVAGRRCLLVDTGGFTRRPGGPLEEAVTAASLAAAEQSHVVVLVVDVQRLGEDDLDLIERARAWGPRVILAVNKVDTDRRDAEAFNLRRLGFARFAAVSAEHGRNIDALLDEISSLLPSGLTAGGEEPAAGETVRVAILGKPNTGKSTLLNRLLGRPRSLVSEVPGTTRDVIEGAFDYSGRRIVVLDTAGIRRRTRISTPLERFSVGRAIDSIRRADVVLLVVDAVEGLAEQDKKIASLAVREGRALVFVLNKWDLLLGDAAREREAGERVHRLLPAFDFAPVLAVSARTGRNVGRLLETVVAVHRELNTRVGTGVLNKSLREWTREHPPSARYNVKIRYGTQVSANPQRFVFFANSSRRLPVSYRRYLAGRLRRSFGLERVPVGLEIRARGG